MMQLFWTREAIQDRDEIYDYIEADNAAAALALDELFSEKASRLVDHPGLGRPGRVPRTRELIARKFDRQAASSLRYCRSTAQSHTFAGPTFSHQFVVFALPGRIAMV